MGVERTANLDIGFTVDYWEPRSIAVDLVNGQIIALFTPFKDKTLYESVGHDGGIESESRRVTFPLYARDENAIKTLRDWVCGKAVDRLPVLYGATADTGAPVTTQPDTTPPHEVENLVATEQPTGVTVTWTNPTDSDFDHVIIDGRKVGTSTWTEYTGSINPSGTLVTLPQNGEQYEVRVRTVDLDGNTSNGVSGTITTNDNTPPDEVLDLTLTPGDLEIVATWTPSADEDLDTFIVSGRKADTGGGTPGAWNEFTGTIDPAGTTIPTPTNDEVYDIRVQSVDFDGNVSTGAIAQATPTASP